MPIENWIWSWFGFSEAMKLVLRMATNYSTFPNSIYRLFFLAFLLVVESKTKLLLHILHSWCILNRFTSYRCKSTPTRLASRAMIEENYKLTSWRAAPFFPQPMWQKPQLSSLAVHFFLVEVTWNCILIDYNRENFFEKYW